MPNRLKSVWLGYIALLHLTVLVLAVLLIRVDRNTSASNPRALRHAMLSSHQRIDANVRDDSVLFFGDSHIQGLAVTAVHPRGVNYGIGHDSTGGLADRIQNYSSLGRASLVVIMIGTNDVLRGHSSEEILRNFREICERIPSDTPVIVCSILPVGRKVSSVDCNERIATINRSLRDWCGNNSRLQFLDVATELAAVDGSLQEKFAVPDGVHLSPQGYERWIAFLSDVITNAAE